MKFMRKKTVRAAMMATCSIALIVGGRFWYLEEQGNFHPITHGQAYRSAQLDRDELAHYIRKFKIRSVINLRGAKAGKPWYQEETATCRQMGVSHFDIRLHADKAPDSPKLEKLLRLFQLAPRPVLIHCKAGADRSGLAAAIWKAAMDNVPARVAKRQLSIRFGHMPVGPTQVLDAFFDQWARAKNDHLNTGKMVGDLFNRSENAVD
jgi:undecaprenyl-diphosphatase